MKLHCKQLDTETSNYIANALEHYANYLWNSYNLRADLAQDLANQFRHVIPLLITEDPQQEKEEQP